MVRKADNVNNRCTVLARRRRASRPSGGVRRSRQTFTNAKYALLSLLLVLYGKKPFWPVHRRIIAPDARVGLYRPHIGPHASARLDAQAPAAEHALGRARAAGDAAASARYGNVKQCIKCCFHQQIWQSANTHGGNGVEAQRLFDCHLRVD